MNCTNCGHELTEGSKFCTECGQPVRATYEPAAYQQERTTHEPRRTTYEPERTAYEPGRSSATHKKKHKKKKKKKPIYKRWWFIVLAVFFALAFIGSLGSDETEVPEQEPEMTATETAAPEITPEPTPEETPEPTPEPTPEITEDEYKAMCEEYTYKDVMRNPENYVGKKIKIKVKLYQELEGGFIDTYKYYRAYDDESGYEWYLDNEYVIFDDRADTSLKLLIDDVIAVWGEIKEPEEMVRALTSTSDEIFSISMKYAELVGE